MVGRAVPIADDRGAAAAESPTWINQVMGLSPSEFEIVTLSYRWQHMRRNYVIKIEVQMICPDCGFKGKPVKSQPFFPLGPSGEPDWGHPTQHDVCPKCSSRNMVSIDSPSGKRFLEKFK